MYAIFDGGTTYPNGTLALIIDGVQVANQTNFGLVSGIPFDFRVELLNGRTQVYVDDILLWDYEGQPTDDNRKKNGGLTMVHGSRSSTAANRVKIDTTKFYKVAA